jgi:hypothetical protein
MILKVAAFVGLFCTNAVQLAMSQPPPTDILIYLILSILLLSVGSSLIILGRHADIFMVFCDSLLFGITIGWMISVVFSDLDHYRIYFGLNLVLIVTLFVDDALEEYKRSPTNTFKSVNSYKNLNVEATRSFDGSHHGDLHCASIDSDNIELSDYSRTSKTRRNSKNKHITSNDQIRICHLYDDESFYQGFRVLLNKFPSHTNSNTISMNLKSDDFQNVEHRVDSSSCHICSAYYKNSPAIIKIIKAERMTSAQAMSEFEMEASVLSKIEHPNIVKLYGTGEYPRPFLVLELLDGGSLSHSLGLRPDAHNRICKKDFTYLETLKLAYSLAHALDYLHNRWHHNMHIIHRDLKPDNIGFSSDGILKLFDFGLCACVRAQRHPSDGYKMTGNTGTLRYMAPEVALGKEYNKSVDVYSFGIIIWQVLKGRVPFANLTKKAFMDQVVKGGERPPLSASWPNQFKILLQRCWHQHKENRPDFSDVLRELDQLIEDAIRKENSGLIVISRRFLNTFNQIAGRLYFMRAGILAFSAIIFFVGIVALSAKGIARSFGSILVILSTISMYAICMSYIQQLRGSPHSNHFVGLERNVLPGVHGQNDPNCSIFNPLVTSTAIKSFPITVVNTVSTPSSMGETNEENIMFRNDHVV